MQALNATFSLSESALGEIITPGSAPDEPLCLYEPLFPLLMDQLPFTKSCFCKAKGKKTHLKPGVRPCARREPWGHGENPAVIYPGQLHGQCQNVLMDKPAHSLSALISYAHKLCGGVFPMGPVFGLAPQLKDL